MNAIRRIPAWSHLSALFVAFALTRCAMTQFDAANCPQGTQKLADCRPADAVQDPETARYYDSLSQLFAARAGFDPMAYARTVDIPVLHTSAKFVGGWVLLTSGLADALNKQTEFELKDVCGSFA